MKKLLLICGFLLVMLCGCNEKPKPHGIGDLPTVNEQAASADRAANMLQPPIPQDLIPVSGPTVVDFYATWCGPCKQLTPILEGLETKYQGRVAFLRIDVDEQPDLAQAFQVESIPTLFFITPAGVVDACIGLSSESELDAQIQSMLGR